MATTKTKPQTVKLHKLCRQRLRPLIRYCELTHGGIANVQRRLEKLTGFKPAWHQVGSWLHPEPSKWRMPTYGNGVALEIVWLEIKHETDYVELL